MAWNCSYIFKLQGNETKVNTYEGDERHTKKSFEGRWREKKSVIVAVVQFTQDEKFSTNIGHNSGVLPGLTLSPLNGVAPVN